MKWATLILLLIFAGCQNPPICKATFIPTWVDTTKPYSLKGEYCLKEIKDSLVLNSEALVQIEVFERRTGLQRTDGAIWFYGPDTSSMRVSLVSEKIVRPGRYKIDAWSTSLMNTRTKTIVIRPNSVVRGKLSKAYTVVW